MKNSSINKINYFHRNKHAGISIYKVSATLTKEVSKHFDIEEHYLPTQRVNLKSIIKNIIFVFKHRNKNGVNHLTGDAHYCILGLIGCYSVLTIHDLVTIERSSNRIKREIMKFLWFKLPLLVANEVICISENTKNELMKLTKRSDIKVIYNALDSTFCFKEKEFDEKKPVILQVGTAWNKNLNNVIKAIKEIDCYLIIIGPVDNNVGLLLKELNISFSVKTNITDEQLLMEYENCDIVMFCSIYEGFGMPIIEANATGRCVITSALQPMSEIGSNAACYVNPNSIISITDGIKKIITDRSFRSQIIKNGIINSEKFKASKIAANYMDLYSQFIKKAKNC